MIKFKNNKLFKNIIILLISGATSKIIGMLGKIIYTRIAGVEVVSLYTLITPTLMLIITITQFSFPISISKISAEHKYDNHSLLKSSYFVAFIIYVVTSIILLLTNEIIANMLHNNSLKYAIISIIFTLPFISISSIQRGFLHGKEDMFMPSLTNIIEEIIKIALIFIFLPIAVLKSNITAVVFLILFNVITEVSSIWFMSKTIKKKYIDKKQGKVNKNIIKDIINISIPTTGVRLISSLGFFLEPIILTNVLLSKGFNLNYITLEYGIINSYIVPLLMVPSFFSVAIASALLPNITKAYTNKKYNEFNSKLIKLLILSIIVGILCLVFILIFPKQILKLVFNVNFGINYIYMLAPFFIFLYMQPTLSIAMQASNNTNKLFIISTISIVLKYFVLFISGYLNQGMNSLIYAIITGIIITTLLLFFTVVLNLNKKT